MSAIASIVSQHRGNQARMNYSSKSVPLSQNFEVVPNEKIMSAQKPRERRVPLFAPLDITQLARGGGCRP